MENPNLKNFLARAHFRARCARLNMTQNAKKQQFLGEFSNFRRAQRARKCARAKIFFRFGFSIKNRWLLHQKRSKNLLKSHLNLNFRAFIVYAHIRLMLKQTVNFFEFWMKQKDSSQAEHILISSLQIEQILTSSLQTEF